MLTQAQRGFAIAKLEEGWSLGRVANEIGCSRTTIFNLKRKWDETQDLGRRPGTGAARSSTQAEDQNLVQYIQEHPFATAIKAVEETHFPASLVTARKRIRAGGLFSSVAAKKPRLSEENKNRRAQFANDFINRPPNFWENVVFSDEKIFQSTYNGQLKVYRPRGQKFEEQYIHQTDNSGRFAVNVWGWISAEGPGALHIIDGRLTAQKYVELLEEVMLPSVRNRFPNDFIFQHDNSPIHTARVVRNWLDQNEIDVLPWAAKSPDLNPIENIWGFMTKKIYNHEFRPRNREELSQAIQNEWNNLEEDYNMRNLIESMQRRLQSVLNCNGGSTKY